MSTAGSLRRLSRRRSGSTAGVRGIALLSPIVAFPALWILSASLAQIHLLDIQRPWSTMTWLVVAAVPIAFVCGGAIAIRLVEQRVRVHSVARGAVRSRVLRAMLVVFLIVGWAELIHQFAASGGIPVLSGQADDLRFNQVGGPTLLLRDFLTVAIIVALVVPRDLSWRHARFELGVAAVGLFGFVLEAGRGQIVLPLAVALVARCLVWGWPRWRIVLGAGALIFAVVVAAFYLRVAQHSDDAFGTELYGEVLPGLPAIAVALFPLYLALATNFEALARVVDHFPSAEPFAHGLYSAGGIDYFVTDARGIGEVSAQLSPPWVTSTVAGSLWADGGMPVVVLFLALIGGVTTGAFTYARRTGCLRHQLVAAYFLYLVLFGVYTNLWTHYIDWLVVAPLLLVVGAFAENPRRPPGWTGWGLERVQPILERLRPAVGGLRSRARSSVNIARSVASQDNARTAADGSGGGRGRRSLVALIAGAVLVLAILMGLGVLLKDESPEGGIEVSESHELPASRSGAPLGETDGDIPTGNASIWRAGVGADDNVRELRFVEGEDGVRVSEHTTPVRLADGAEFDVAQWNPLRGDAVFELRETPKSVTVRVLDSTEGSELASGTAPLPRLPKGARRDLAIATWDGDRPDLFVIERGLALEPATVRVFSGESGFRENIEEIALPFRRLNPDVWRLDVGNLANPGGEQRPDLIMFKKLGESGKPEIHVLSGETGLQSFAMQASFSSDDGLEYGFGSSLGVPALYAVTAEGGGDPEVRVFRLRQAPPVE